MRRRLTVAAVALLWAAVAHAAAAAGPGLALDIECFGRLDGSLCQAGKGHCSAMVCVPLSRLAARCPDIECTLECPYGYKKDPVTTCQLCACAPKGEPACPPELAEPLGVLYKALRQEYDSKDCCAWPGVFCDTRPAAAAAGGTAGAVVAQVFLRGRGLGGSIPDAVAALGDRVTSLDLGGNRLRGSLPPGLLNLTGLVRLAVDDNRLRGTVPADLGNLTALQQLSLGHNPGVSGRIPDSLYGMPALTHAFLGNMSLQCALPGAAKGLSALRALDVSHNWVYGGVPPWLPALAGLASLDVADTLVESPMPPALVARLGERLRCARTFVNEEPCLPRRVGRSPLAPEGGGAAAALHAFKDAAGYGGWRDQGLGVEVWAGDRPCDAPWLGVRCANDTVLELALPANGLAGTLSPALGTLAHLRALVLPRNGLGGALPPELSFLTALTRLDLSGNLLTGAFSQDLLGLSELVTLRLAGNLLTGLIPDLVGSLSKVAFLDLADNRLEGTLPSDVGRISSLKALLVNGNRLEGTVPAEVGRIPALRHLHVQGNLLLDPLPALPAGVELECGGNWLRDPRCRPRRGAGDADGPGMYVDDREQLMLLYNGTGGPEWERRRHWASEAVPVCRWEGVECEPDRHGRPRVTAVRLADNNLQGPFPAALLALPHLRALALPGNNLTGPLPAAGYGDGLRALDLARNGLAGTIPPAAVRLPLLELLDLSRNRLDGSIPDPCPGCAGGRPARLPLRTLRLAHNGLSSSVPEGVLRLGLLDALDLSANQLSGTVDARLARLPLLTSLDLADNLLTGFLARDFALSATLLHLNVSRNNLEGAVAADYGRLGGGKAFDCSRNYLAAPACAPAKPGAGRQAPADPVPGYRLMFQSHRDPTGKGRLLAAAHAPGTPDTAGLPAEARDDTVFRALRAYGCWHNDTLAGPAAWAEAAALDANFSDAPLEYCAAAAEGAAAFALGGNGAACFVAAAFNASDLAAAEPFAGCHEGLGGRETVSIYAFNFRPNATGQRDVLMQLYAALGGPGWRGAGPAPLEPPRPTGAGAPGALIQTGAGAPGWVEQPWPFQQLRHNSSRINGGAPTPASAAGVWQADGGDDLCAWLGVGCTQGMVTHVALSAFGATGKVPAALFGLHGLRQLWLDHNSIVGPIPTEVGLLRALEQLCLHHNMFTGGIPTEIGNVVALQFLHLRGNRLTGAIPTEMARLRFLRYVTLDNNRLGGTLPGQLATIPTLAALRINENMIKGALPAGFANATADPDLPLDFNCSSTFIDDDACAPLFSGRDYCDPDPCLNGGACRNTDEGYACDCTADFAGPVCAFRQGVLDAVKGVYDSTQGAFWRDSRGWSDPTGLVGPCEWFGVVCEDGLEVSQLILRDNHLRGTLPEDVGNNFPALRFLDLRLNYIAGPLPASLGNLTSLDYLVLQGNRFTGAIPAGLGGLPQLDQLWLAHNRLDGPIPPFANPTLRVLSLHNNNLTGPVPATADLPPAITHLLLHGNALSGGLWGGDGGGSNGSAAAPAALGELRTLDASDNALAGRLPADVLRACPALRVVSLHHNRLAGSPWAAAAAAGGPPLRHLTTLVLSHNNFSLPPDGPALAANPALVRVELGANQMEGVVPTELGRMEAVELLDLSHNGFEDAIPSQLGLMYSLVNLSLGHNFFSGPAPDQLRHLARLRHLDLSHNLLEGDLNGTGLLAAPNLTVHCRRNFLTTQWCKPGRPHPCSVPAAQELCLNDGECAMSLRGEAVCRCPGGTSGERCEVLDDPCAVQPCANAGVCSSPGPGEFACACALGYTGRTCTDRVDYCGAAGSPCRRRGVCENVVGGFRCRCRAPWSGPDCETKGAACQPNPCQHGGVCADSDDGVVGYACDCARGYSGADCSVAPLGACASEPCLNGGACVASDGAGDTYACVCAAGFAGGRCERPVDNCTPNPCQRGSCSFRPAAPFFKCDCEPGFSGPLCADPADPCAREPCHHGSRCVAGARGGFSCECAVGFGGSRCDMILPAFLPSGQTASPAAFPPPANGTAAGEGEGEGAPAAPVAFSLDGLWPLRLPAAPAAAGPGGLAAVAASRHYAYAVPRGTRQVGRVPLADFVPAAAEWLDLAAVLDASEATTGAAGLTAFSAAFTDDAFVYLAAADAPVVVALPHGAASAAAAQVIDMADAIQYGAQDAADADRVGFRGAAAGPDGRFAYLVPDTPAVPLLLKLGLSSVNPRLSGRPYAASADGDRGTGVRVMRAPLPPGTHLGPSPFVAGDYGYAPFGPGLVRFPTEDFTPAGAVLLRVAGSEGVPAGQRVTGGFALGSFVFLAGQGAVFRASALSPTLEDLAMADAAMVVNASAAFSDGRYGYVVVADSLVRVDGDAAADENILAGLRLPHGRLVGGAISGGFAYLGSHNSATLLRLQVAASGPDQCAAGWSPFDGACYAVTPRAARSLPQAERLCAALPGSADATQQHVASVHSPEENAFVAGLAPSSVRAWLGATLNRTLVAPPDGDAWHWTDSSAYAYRAFGLGMPTAGANCTVMQTNKLHVRYGHWETVPCAVTSTEEEGGEAAAADDAAVAATGFPAVCKYPLAVGFGMQAAAGGAALKAGPLVAEADVRPPPAEGAEPPLVPGGVVAAIGGGQGMALSVEQTVSLDLDGRAVTGASVVLSGVLDDGAAVPRSPASYHLTVLVNGRPAVQDVALEAIEHGAPVGQPTNIRSQRFAIGPRHLRAFEDGANTLKLQLRAPPGGWLAITRLSVTASLATPPAAPDAIKSFVCHKAAYYNLSAALPPAGRPTSRTLPAPVSPAVEPPAACAALCLPTAGCSSFVSTPDSCTLWIDPPASGSGGSEAAGLPPVGPGSATRAARWLELVQSDDDDRLTACSLRLGVGESDSGLLLGASIVNAICVDAGVGQPTVLRQAQQQCALDHPDCLARVADGQPLSCECLGVVARCLQTFGCLNGEPTALRGFCRARFPPARVSASGQACAGHVDECFMASYAAATERPVQTVPVQLPATVTDEWTLSGTALLESVDWASASPPMRLEFSTHDRRTGYVAMAQLTRIASTVRAPDAFCVVGLAVDGVVVTAVGVDAVPMPISMHGAGPALSKGLHVAELVFRSQGEGNKCKLLSGRGRITSLLSAPPLLAAFPATAVVAAAGAAGVVVKANETVTPSGGWSDLPGPAALAVSGFENEARSDVLVLAQVGPVRHSTLNAVVELRLIVDDGAVLSLTNVIGDGRSVSLHGSTALYPGSHSARVQYRSATPGAIQFGGSPATRQLTMVSLGVSRTLTASRASTTFIADTPLRAPGRFDGWKELVHPLSVAVRGSGETAKATLVVADVTGISHDGGATPMTPVRCRLGLYVDDTRVGDAEIMLCGACPTQQGSVFGAASISPGDHDVRVKVACAGGAARSSLVLVKGATLRLTASTVHPAPPASLQQDSSDSRAGTGMLVTVHRTAAGFAGAYSTTKVRVLPGERYKTTVYGTAGLTPQGVGIPQLRVVAAVGDMENRWVSGTGDSLPVAGVPGLQQASVEYTVPSRTTHITPFVGMTGGTGGWEDSFEMVAAPVTEHIGTSTIVNDMDEGAKVWLALGQAYAEHTHLGGLVNLGLDLSARWAARDGWSAPESMVRDRLCVLDGLVVGSTKEKFGTVVRALPRSCWPDKRVVAMAAVGSVGGGDAATGTARVDVLPDGRVVLGPPSAAGWWASLSSVRYVPYATPDAPAVKLLGTWRPYTDVGFQLPHAEVTRGLCSVGGLVRGGDNAEAVAELPVGCRPRHRSSYVLQVDGGATVRADVLPTGELVLMSGRVQAKGWLSLSGILFPVVPRPGHALSVQLSPGWISAGGAFGDVEAQVIYGVCAVSGTVVTDGRDAGRVVAQLPEGCWPRQRVLHTASDNGRAILLSIFEDGTISLVLDDDDDDAAPPEEVAGPASTVGIPGGLAWAAPDATAAGTRTRGGPLTRNAGELFANIQQSLVQQQAGGIRRLRADRNPRPRSVALTGIVFATMQPNPVVAPSLTVTCDNPHAGPAGVAMERVAVQPNKKYRFTVRGRVRGKANAHLWVRDDRTARNLIWPGPALQRASRDLSVQFDTPVGCQHVAIGVLFRGVHRADEMVIESLAELVEIPGALLAAAPAPAQDGGREGLFHSLIAIRNGNASAASNRSSSNASGVGGGAGRRRAPPEKARITGTTTWYGFNNADAHWSAWGAVSMDDGGRALPFPIHVRIPGVDYSKEEADDSGSIDAEPADEPDTGVCQDTAGEPLGMSSGKILSRAITASSQSPDCLARFGRLNQLFRTGDGLLYVDGGWCPSDGEAPLYADQWLQMDLGSIHNVTTIDTQGLSGIRPAWTTKYTVAASVDGVLWEFLLNQTTGEPQQLSGNRDANIVSTVRLTQHIRGRFVRIYPTEWATTFPALRVELHGCPDVAAAPTPPPLSAQSISEPPSAEEEVMDELMAAESAEPSPPSSGPRKADCGPYDCSGRGECVADGVCECEGTELGPFWGPNCEIPPSDLRFKDISQLLSDNPSRISTGLTVADTDGDGEFEIAVTGPAGHPNLLLSFNGVKLNDLAASTALADKHSSAIAVAAGDTHVDGTGRESLYVVNSEAFSGPKQTPDRLFRRDVADEVARPDVAPTFTDLAAGSGVHTFAARGVAAVDVSGGGKYSFAVASYGGPLELMQMDAAGRLVDAAAAAGISPAIVAGRAVLAAPLRGGGSAAVDIFVGADAGMRAGLATAETDGNRLLRSGDGGGTTFTEAGLSAGLADPARSCRSVAALCEGAQCDVSAPLSLLVANADGRTRLFSNVSGGVAYRDVATPAIADLQDPRSILAADFDGDGVDELFVASGSGPNQLLAWRGDAWVTVNAGAAAEPAKSTSAAAVLDVDGDGSLELVLGHDGPGAQPLSVYTLGRNANHYVRIRPLTVGGAPARGARVALQQRHRSQLKVVGVGSSEPVAHFGLGPDTSPLQVTVLWPDGSQKQIPGDELPVDATLRVAHPATD